MLHVRGHWSDRRQIPPSRAQLLVEVDGRRERYTATPGHPGAIQPGDWRTRFELPAWIEPYLRGRAFLELGSHRPHPSLGWLVELPAPNGAALSPDPGIPVTASVDDTAQLAAKVRHLERSLVTAREEPTRLREALGRAQAELSGRLAQQQRFDAARAELQNELERVRAELAHERARGSEVERRSDAADRRAESLRAELAGLTVARDAAIQEAAGLRAELQRLGSALTAVDQRTGPDASAIAEAEALLAEARSVRGRAERRTSASLSTVDEV
ncbi:MAG: hypothetical protein ACXVQR_07530 [Solirubrobacteraceae bacterium]